MFIEYHLGRELQVVGSSFLKEHMLKGSAGLHETCHLACQAKLLNELFL